MDKIKPIHIITVCLVIIALTSIYLVKEKAAEKSVQEERAAAAEKYAEERRAEMKKEHESVKKLFGGK